MVDHVSHPSTSWGLFLLGPLSLIQSFICLTYCLTRWLVDHLELIWLVLTWSSPCIRRVGFTHNTNWEIVVPNKWPLELQAWQWAKGCRSNFKYCWIYFFTLLIWLQVAWPREASKRKRNGVRLGGEYSFGTTYQGELCLTGGVTNDSAKPLEYGWEFRPNSFLVGVVFHAMAESLEDEPVGSFQCFSFSFVV